MSNTPEVRTVRAKVVAVQHCTYKAIVVEDLDRDITDELKYVAITILPNWEFANPFEVGSIGFFQFQWVVGGRTEWFDRITNQMAVYKYNNHYLLNFFKEQDTCQQEKFKF